MRANRKRNILRLCKNKKEGEEEEEKKKRSLLAFSQTLLALGATSSMRGILSLVSFPIYYSQLCERDWWRDQQQSLTIYPGATPSYSCAKETLITTAGDSGEAAKLAKSCGSTRALIFRASMD